MRGLTAIEKAKLEILTKNQVSIALIELTTTGLKKSILDATGSVRRYLKENDLHDYEAQNQGQAHKVIIETLIYSDSEIIKSRASLYRPNTKKGDPRIWFSILGKFLILMILLLLSFMTKNVTIQSLYWVSYE